MRIFLSIVAAAGAITLMPAPALAGPKVLQRYHVKVDGRAFKVVTYVDGSVKVILGGMFGPAQSVQLRETMRRAVASATGCTIADDFFLDGRLAGTLGCDDRVGPTAQQPT